MSSKIAKYYKFMELDESCSDSDLRKAYRKLAKIFHPDKSKEERSHQKFNILNRVYEKLQSYRKKAHKMEMPILLNPIPMKMFDQKQNISIQLSDSNFLEEFNMSFDSHINLLDNILHSLKEMKSDDHFDNMRGFGQKQVNPVFSKG